MTSQGWGRRTRAAAIRAGVMAVAIAAPPAAPSAAAEDIFVPAGGDLQAAINRAKPGDTIRLAAGAEFVGTFVLPVKSGDGPIVIRSATADAQLPPAGTRIAPSHAPLLARLRSSTTSAVVRTAAGAHHWRLQYLEFGPNREGYGDILAIGDGSSSQNTSAEVPRAIVLSHLYVHGDPLLGQKRCIALNASDVTIRDSYVADCKGVGMDTQAIGGWNGPGPYTIENNYLEGAGENIMLGGADPSIPDLVADGVTIRGNHLFKPMAWRDPIIPTPAGVAAADEPGGSLPPGTYSYRVIARRRVGQGTVGRSTASQEVAVTATGGAVRVTWTPVPHATEYFVYGRTAGALTQYWKVTTPSFVDSGAPGTAGTAPTSAGTVWTVKNLFELKNARNVLVEYNLLENHWKEAQPGYAVLFTPRNSNGACTWCVVERVTFQYNVVRHVSAGINLLGRDGGHVSGQARDITIRENLFYDLTTALGGNGWFMLIGDGPRDVTIDHNTIDHDGTTLVYAYGGTAAAPAVIEGMRFTNNIARHGSYGMSGAHFAYGNANLAGYYPGIVFSRNLLAGASASRYPAGTLTGPFDSEFVAAAQNDFRLRAGSSLASAGTDGTPVGCRVQDGWSWVQAVESGLSAIPRTEYRPAAPKNLRIVLS